jgi:RND family efflux transporter MFP subunit
MKLDSLRKPLLAGLAPLTLALVVAAAWPSSWASKEAAPAVKPALTVTLTQASTETWPVRVSANGSLAAWQEAIISSEVNGLRLAELRAQVGESVKRGQVLAVFSDELVQADVAMARAAVNEAEAVLAEAVANANRARELSPKGVISAQQAQQAYTAERTAQARLESAKAAEQAQRLRLKFTQVVAPDAGLISARSATVGAVMPAGQEMFRLIRQGRLEWRAEVAASDLASIKPGMGVFVTPAGGAPMKGSVRQVSPAIDPASRNGLVYVDLAPSVVAEYGARAGMFARGEFEVKNQSGLTLPQSAVVQRDGFAYVMRLGEQSRVQQTKVSLGRRSGDRVEVLGGLDAKAKVVASGAAFLADGDVVRVVSAPAIPANGIQAPDPAPAAGPAKR